MADQTNPFTMAGMMGMMQPNKYIDPAYKDKPLPLPGFYGAPTDAQGNPIQSFTDAQAQHDAWQPPAAPPQGTTLNSAPSNPLTQATGPGGLNQMGLNPNAYGLGLQSGPSPMNPSGNAAQFAANWGGMMPTSGAYGGAQQARPAAAPAPTNPIDMRQAYLTALSNPGKVTTPGANVPQAQPLGTPSVMDSFLSAHPGGGEQGAGNYSNEGFFSTLNKLRAS